MDWWGMDWYGWLAVIIYGSSLIIGTIIAGAGGISLTGKEGRGPLFLIMFWPVLPVFFIAILPFVAIYQVGKSIRTRTKA